MIENWVNWEIWEDVLSARVVAGWWVCNRLVGACVMHACGTLTRRARTWPGDHGPSTAFHTGRSSETSTARGRRAERAPRPMNGPDNAPVPRRGPVCLTAREPSSTLPLDEKGRLKFLFPKHMRAT